MWFNQPYSYNVATDIGKKILTAREKFWRKILKMHKSYKVFNQNNFKVSYSSMPNISSIIKSHNKKILSNDKSKSSKSSYDCKDKSSCPINGNSLEQNVKCDILQESHPTERVYQQKHKRVFLNIDYANIKTNWNTIANKMQRICLISYGTRKAKTSTYHSHRVF